MSQLKQRVKKQPASFSCVMRPETNLSSDEVLNEKVLSADVKCSSQSGSASVCQQLPHASKDSLIQSHFKTGSSQVIQYSAEGGYFSFDQPISKLPGLLWKDKRFLLLLGVISFMFITLISVILAIHVFEVEKPFTQRSTVSHTLIRHIIVENVAEPYDFNRTYWNSIRGYCGILDPSIINNNKANGRIAGGEQAVMKAWPWVVAIVRYKDYGGGYEVYSLQCGGALIGPYSIVTAASCFYNITVNQVQTYSGDLRVIVGAHDLNSLVDGARLVRIRSILINVRNNLESLITSRELPQNDLALILLEERIEFDPVLNLVDIICLPLPHELPPLTKRCWLVGWGRTHDYEDRSKSKILKQVSQVVISKTRCRSYYGDMINYNMQICAQDYYAGACDGDRGGPLMCLGDDQRWTLYGAVSFNPPTCIAGPVVYTSITKYIEWICCFATDAAPCSRIECRYSL